MVDATYRSDLRELNESNFARFDAKLEQRLAELKAELTTAFTSRMVELRSEMLIGFKNAELRGEQQETRLTKRLFAFWVVQAATAVGLIFGVVKILY